MSDNNTVQDLIDILKNCDPTHIVVSTPDGEYFREGLDISVGMSFNDNQVGLTKLTQELEDRGFGDEDILEDGIPCIVFWPT